MKKFQLQHFSDDKGTVLLHHNLEPKITMSISYEAYDGDQLYDQLNVNGVYVKGIALNYPNDVDPETIRKYIRKALFWYAGQVYVERN